MWSLVLGKKLNTYFEFILFRKRKNIEATAVIQTSAINMICLLM